MHLALLTPPLSQKEEAPKSSKVVPRLPRLLNSWSDDMSDDDDKDDGWSKEDNEDKDDKWSKDDYHHHYGDNDIKTYIK
jgi:hypothetical protein